MKKTSATIYDVAKLAGVSPSTVSFIFNRSNSYDRIPVSTRQRVEKAIQDLSYRPNAGGRSMVLKRYETIGVLFSGDSASLGRRLFYRDLLDGVEHACAEADYLCVTARTTLQRHDVPKFLRSPCIDGMLAVHHATDVCCAEVKMLNVPILCVNSISEGLPFIRIDDVASTNLAMDKLWEMGHRHIGYISSQSNRDHYSFHHRSQAYLDYMAAKGLAPRCYQPPPGEVGEDFAKWLDAQSEQPLTAVLCYGDDQIQEAASYFKSTGSSAPSKLLMASLSGLEEAPENELRRYPGIMYNTFEIGRQAGKAMLDLLINKTPLPTTLVTGTWRNVPAASTSFQ